MRPKGGAERETLRTTDDGTKDVHGSSFVLLTRGTVTADCYGPWAERTKVPSSAKKLTTRPSSLISADFCAPTREEMVSLAVGSLRARPRANTLVQFRRRKSVVSLLLFWPASCHCCPSRAHNSSNGSSFSRNDREGIRQGSKLI